MRTRVDSEDGSIATVARATGIAGVGSTSASRSGRRE
jgi:hypothetical protein